MSVIARLLGTEVGDGLVIEAMRRRDLRAIMPIEAAAYPTSWSRGVFESEIDQMRAGNRYYLTARRGVEVVGYGGLWFVDGEAHITNIVVAEEHRRRGVATELMVALAHAARQRGCSAWTLEVRSSSVGAQALYRRFWFQPVGVRQRYYDNVEDAVVMWCHDLDSEEYSDLLRRVIDDGR